MPYTISQEEFEGSVAKPTEMCYRSPMTIVKTRIAVIAGGAALAFFALCLPALASAAVPAGFEIQTIVSGLNLPTTVAWAPDGRLFIAEKDGRVRIYKNGALLLAPFIQLTDINTYSDHGLLGIALDPSFNTNHYVYLLYTYENDPANYTGLKTGRLIRVTAADDVADETTKTTLLGSVGGTPAAPSCENYAVTSDCIPSDSPSHSVGGLRFGPDGKLYAALGDGAHYDYMDPRALRAQNLDSLGGKIIRMNTDGTAPADNPFYNGDPNANRSKVWNYGLRNDFRFNFRPSNGTLYLGDVGWYSYEEINIGYAGRNFGWPCREGFVATPAYNCTPASPAADPSYAYAHDPVTGAGAVVGGVFATGVYPAPYAGSYFFGDFAINFIKRMTVDGSDNLVAVDDFMTGAGGPVEIVNGPDGYMYYLSIYSGELRRIFYTAGNRAPIAAAAANPTSGLLPLVVNFSSAGSSDPDGDSLAFAWNFGDSSATSTDANPSHTYVIVGPYVATLTVSDAHGGSDQKTVSVYAGNRAPTATILPPAGGPFYEPNQPVSISGTAHDPEDGDLPDADFSWQVILHHNIHSHIVQTLVGKNVSFLGPDHAANDNIYVELVLTVHDSVGLTDTKSINLYRNVTNPHLVQIRTAPEANIVTFQHTLITATVTNNGSTGPVLVDIEVFKDGLKADQMFWDNEIIQTGENRQFTFDWSPQSAGTYRIAVGLIHPGWSGLFEWTNDALSLAVSSGTPPPLAAFTPEHRGTTANTVLPIVNQPVRLVANVQNVGIAGDALVDFEIFKNDLKIGQAFYDNEHFEASQTRQFTFDWTPTEMGDYRVAIGLIHPGWTGLYQWTNAALLMHVSETPPPPPAPGIPVYTDALDAAWASWSWDTAVNFAATPAGAGTSALAATYAAPWAGLYLHTNALDLTGKTQISFMISGGASGYQGLQIVMFNAANAALTPRKLDPYLPAGGLLPNTWYAVSIPLADLGVSGTSITGFAIQGSTGNIEPTFLLDNIFIR